MRRVIGSQPVIRWCRPTRTITTWGPTSIGAVLLMSRSIRRPFRQMLLVKALSKKLCMPDQIIQINSININLLQTIFDLIRQASSMSSISMSTTGSHLMKTLASWMSSKSSWLNPRSTTTWFRVSIRREQLARIVIILFKTSITRSKQIASQRHRVLPKQLLTFHHRSHQPRWFSLSLWPRSKHKPLFRTRAISWSGTIDFRI